MESSNKGFINQNSQPTWPYHRCYRPIRDTDGSSIEDHNYLVDHEYAKYPEKYTRAFLLIQKEMKNLFEYIEPGDNNLKTYSNQIQQLLVRICIEIEANFKAIFKENIYPGQEKDWKMKDYQLIDKSHRLSDYQVVMPFWDGKKNTFQPFFAWKKASKLKWYSAYNIVKHNRADQLKAANFENLMNAFCGLFVVLTAQFKNQEYSSLSVPVIVGSGYNSYYEGEFGIGDMLQAKYPDWADDDKYYFKYDYQNPQRIMFRKFDYSNLINE